MKVKIIIGLIIAIIIGIAIFAGCKSKYGNVIKGQNPKKLHLNGDEKIEKIEYSYVGIYIGGIYTYTIFKENQEVKLKVEYMNINEENPYIVSIDGNTLDKAMELVKKHNVNNWDGYHKSAINVLDGDGFSMSIKFNDEKSISFSGSNCAPDGFYPFLNELLELIKADTQKANEIILKDF